MTRILQRKLPSLLAQYRSPVNRVKTPQRFAVTVTDEYQPGGKPRSSLKGVELLRNPAMNKVNTSKKGKTSAKRNSSLFSFPQGMAFSLEERQHMGIHGLLPPAVVTQDLQAFRVMSNVHRAQGTRPIHLQRK